MITSNFFAGVLVNALNSTDATVTFAVDKKFADNTGAYYNLTDDIATGIIQNIELTVKNTSSKAIEMMRISGITSTTTTSDGRPIYTGTIEVNGATKLRGLANTYDGTNSTTNVIANKIITTFPKNSPCLIAVNSGQLQRALDLFATGTTTDTAEAGENLTALNSVSLHSDGKVYKYHASNYPNLCGIVTGTISSGATATFIRNEGTSTGHTALTPGVLYYAENTGAITATPSATTRLIGQAKSATAIYVTVQVPKDSAFADNAFYVGDESDGTKKAVFSLGGATTGKTVTFVSSHTDNRTITFPDATGTLLNFGSANVSDAGFRIQDDGDNTKQVAFQASGITTGTTRTLTVQDKSYTIADDAEIPKKIQTGARVDASGGSGTGTITNFAENIDSGSNFSSGTFTAPETANYLVSCGGNAPAISGEVESFTLTLKKNGSTDVQTMFTSGGTQDAVASFLSCTRIIALTATNTLTLVAAGDESFTNCYMSIQQLP